jgi:hypothetical protein
MACRNQLELEGMVGYFVNPVVLRAYPAGDLPVASLLHAVSQTVGAAVVHRVITLMKVALSFRAVSG